MSAATEPAAPVLDLRNVSKTFGRTTVLDRVHLSIEGGEVHALLGHNGSGKSTLIKILSGYHEPSKGAELFVNGQPISFPIRRELDEKSHFGVVHQDLGLIGSLSVSDNLQLRRAAGTGRWWSPAGRRDEQARALLREHDLAIDVRERVERLKPEDRVAIAVARALTDLRGGDMDDTEVHNGLLVLDEVTAFLPRERKEALYRLIHDIARSGCGVLVISHDIEEVTEISDNVTVLRNGRVVGGGPTGEITTSHLVELIAGRRLEGAKNVSPAQGGDPLHDTLKVEGVSGDRIRGVSLSASGGEILGLTGILGSGYEELPYLLYGARRASQGSLTLTGKQLQLRDVMPRTALDAGLRLIPSDRASEGLVGELPVTDNVTLPSLRTFVHRFVLRRGAMRRACQHLVELFGVTPPNPHMRVSELSGGNQQKVLLAKALQQHPVCVLMHEPTQGVDVGARHEIFRLIRDAAANGVIVLVATSDHAQLAALCHRILIFRGGAISRELRGALSKGDITSAVYATSSSS